MRGMPAHPADERPDPQSCAVIAGRTGAMSPEKLAKVAADDPHESVKVQP
jgi:hypothetical protein